jgi:hypothetical protein
MSRVARFLFLSKGNISKEEAKELARAECARRGVAWQEPSRVQGTGKYGLTPVTAAAM